MYFNIDSAKRVDEDHLEMTMAKVETYNEAGAPEMTIELPVSTLDLNTRILTSTTPVTIRRSDFELTGDTMVFNTVTRRGRLAGNVRMLIFNRDEVAKAPAANESSATPEPAGEEAK
jgi:lipopolysaccharide assembly outer membrane protein LptD (OstA)